MSKPGHPSDRRQFGRRQTNLHGWILIPGRPRLPCIVMDISVGGALIGLKTPPWLPYNFQLTIEATRFTSWCEVKHQRSDAIGVRFLNALETAKIEHSRGGEHRSLSEKDAWAGQNR